MLKLRAHVKLTVSQSLSLSSRSQHFLGTLLLSTAVSSSVQTIAFIGDISVEYSCTAS